MSRINCNHRNTRQIEFQWQKHIKVNQFHYGGTKEKEKEAETKA